MSEAGSGSPVWCVSASYLQQQLYYSVDTRLSNYNVLVTWELLGDVDDGALRQTLRELVGRHEILRTCFLDSAGEVQQRVGDDREPALWKVDLTSMPDPGTEARNVVLTDVARPFALREPPLWRAILASVDTRRHILALVLHHSLCDGWSSMVLERDLTSFYHAIVGRRILSLPDMPIQFGDYAAWEASFRDPVLEREWCERLSPASQGFLLPSALRDQPPFELISHPIPPVSEAVLTRLTEFARQHDATLASLLYAAAILTLSPVLGDDVVFGLAHANRTDSELQPVVGPVFDYLPIRVELGGSPSLVELMQRIRVEETAARARRIPLRTVAHAVAGGQRPVFDLVLNFIPPRRGASQLRRSTDVSPRFVPYALSNDWARVRVDRDFYGAGALSFVLRQGSEGALGGHLYGHGTAMGWQGLAQLGRHFGSTLERLSAEPGYRVTTVDIQA
ncbi:condensation domain-containing protein [Saccharomonospora sp. NPDC046836]|uniref:condensation domain-containing protein n=1 Tax=Saccharomonospora sp. NPDC046836 TaxID=3156921 RepID=UPI0033E77538